MSDDNHMPETFTAKGAALGFVTYIFVALMFVWVFS